MKFSIWGAPLGVGTNLWEEVSFKCPRGDEGGDI
jgi:hypothetical protein